MLVGLKFFYIAATGIAEKSYATSTAVNALDRWKIPMIERGGTRAKTRMVEASFLDAAKAAHAEERDRQAKLALVPPKPVKPHNVESFNSYRAAAIATMERIEYKVDEISAKLDRVLHIWGDE